MPPLTVTIQNKLHYKWWYQYLYLPVFITIYQFIVDYIDLDFEPDWDKFYKVHQSGTYVVTQILRKTND